MISKKLSLLTHLLKNNAFPATSYAKAQDTLNIPPASVLTSARISALQLAGTFLFATLFYFIAYNWNAMTHGYKFLLCGVLYAALALAALFCKPHSLARNGFITLLAVCIGPMLALFGQTYQTGADPWQLFAWWTVFLLGFSLICKSSSFLWFLSWGIGNIAFNLILVQVYDINIFTLDYFYLWVLINIGIYCVTECTLYCLGKKHKQQYHSLMLTLLFLAINTVVCSLYCEEILSNHYGFSTNPLYLFLFTLFIAFAFFYYLRIKPTISSLAIILLNIGIILFTFLMRHITFALSGPIAFFFIAFAILASILYGYFVLFKRISAYQATLPPAILKQENAPEIQEMTWLKSLQQAGILPSSALLEQLLPSSIKDVFQHTALKVMLTFFAWLAAIALIAGFMAFCFQIFGKDMEMFFLIVGILAIFPAWRFFKEPSFFAAQWGLIFALLSVFSITAFIFMQVNYELGTYSVFYQCAALFAVFFFVYTNFFMRLVLASAALLFLSIPFWANIIMWNNYSGSIPLALPLFYVCLILAPTACILLFLTQHRWLQSKLRQYFTPLQYSLLFLTLGNSWLILTRFGLDRTNFIIFSLAYSLPLILLGFIQLFAKMRLPQRIAYTVIVAIILGVAQWALAYYLPHIIIIRFASMAFFYIVSFFVLLHIGRFLPNLFIFVLSGLYLFIWCFALYFIPVISIGEKSFVAATIGTTFLLFALLFHAVKKLSVAKNNRFHQPEATAEPKMPFFSTTNLIFTVFCLLLFAGYAGNVASKEYQLANGETVYLKLAPVDPRSLMQGDYMILDYEITREAEAPYSTLYNRTVINEYNSRYRSENTPLTVEEKATLDRKQIVALKNDKGILTFIKLNYDDTSLGENQVILQFSVNYLNNGSLVFGSNAYFFQEGHGVLYDSAVYGEFVRSSKGMLILQYLCDKNLDRIIPTAEDKEALQVDSQEALNNALNYLIY